MKKATDARGKFDVLRFFAVHQKTFPVNYVLALSSSVGQIQSKLKVTISLVFVA